MSKTIKFNNFKPFGEKMQSFSQKPITLIYGPNSIGKSSLIHLIAYQKQLLTGYFNPKEIRFGDTISLDGFQSFIHKKNANNTITLTFDTQYNNALIETQIGQIEASDNSKIVKDVFIKYYIDDEVIMEVEYVKNEGYNIMLNLRHHHMINKLEIIKNNGGWTNKEFEEALGKPKVKMDLLKNEDLNFSFLKYLIYFSDAKEYDLEDYNLQIYLDEHIKIAKERPLKWRSKDEKAQITIKQMKKADKTAFDNIMLDDQAAKLNKWEYALVSMDNIMFDDDTVLTLDILLKQYAIDLARILNLSAFEKSYKSKFLYIGPLRFYPERNNLHKEIGDNESIDSEKFWTIVQEHPDLKNKLNTWLSDDKLNTPYEIKTRKKYDLTHLFELNKEAYTREDIEKYAASSDELIFRDKRTDTLVHNREMGLGVTQVLPVVGATLLNKGCLIAIEQPELHLHPRIQAEVADEFIRSYKENKNEFLIETHSEHLLLRIMKRMRHTDEGRIDKDDVLALTPDDVCVLYVDNDGESTYIQELRLSPKGKLLDHWPNGFFEEGFKERFS